MTYAIIMAGGVGSRFWPASRQAMPKQFLEVFGNATLIQNTVARLQGLIPPERCFIVTHERYVEQTRQQLPGIPAKNILAEPISRNTAPCIAYAAVTLLAQDPDATMVVLPADHVIRDVRAFHSVLQAAIDQAQTPNALVTIGITPEYPATGYGYVQFDGQVDPSAETPQAYPVLTFAEKPDLATAERFLDSGDFLWNSGMFIWRADSIWGQMQQHLPKAHDAFTPLLTAPISGRDGVLEAFQNSPKISIDYGIMERSSSVYVVPGSFGWSDVGDWRAVYDLGAKDDLGNALDGHVITHGASRCYVKTQDRLVVLVGMHDTVVVDTDDAILVCHKDQTQGVKHVVEYLKVNELDRYV